MQMIHLAFELGLETHPIRAQLRLNEGRLAMGATSCGQVKENIQLVEADYRAGLRKVKARLTLLRQRRDMRTRLRVREMRTKCKRTMKLEKL